MKKILYLLSVFFILCTSCNKLNVAPVSLISDKDVFGSASGIAAYMANLYSYLPIEDHKYGGQASNPTAGFSQFSLISNPNMYCGDEMNKNTGNGDIGCNDQYWADAFSLVRNVAYFMNTLPTHASTFSPTQINTWLGEARFLRAYTYFALAKRYGGVPLVTTVLSPEESIAVQRSSEQETWDFITSELTAAIGLLPATSENRGRVNKYTAAGMLSRAAVYAGSIAKYNTINKAGKSTGKRILGIPSTEAVRYYKLAYNAAVTVEASGLYQLYNADPDKAVNFYKLFFDVSAGNKESMFVKEYNAANTAHSFDVFASPAQMQSSAGTSSYLDPTLDFVELFDGLPRNADGSLKTIDQTTGKFALYNDRLSFFATAEPRLLGSVLIPGATFKGQIIEVRRGIYIGSSAAGISPFAGSVDPFPVVTNAYTSGAAVTSIMTAAADKNGAPAVALPAGGTLQAGGLSGVFTSRDAGTMTGFFQKKYFDESKSVAQVLINGSTQPWVEMRYAEVLLNGAEAAYELYTAGDASANYLQYASTKITAIRTRAGADLTKGMAGGVITGGVIDGVTTTGIGVIRRERRKELGFENKTYWDMRRWRTADLEINNRNWFQLNPIYVRDVAKYIFDKRRFEGNKPFTFSVTQYYNPIPGGELVKSTPALDDNSY
jgi:hypothetical protein